MIKRLNLILFLILPLIGFSQNEITIRVYHLDTIRISSKLTQHDSLVSNLIYFGDRVSIDEPPIYGVASVYFKGNELYLIKDQELYDWIDKSFKNKPLFFKKRLKNKLKFETPKKYSFYRVESELEIREKSSKNPIDTIINIQYQLVVNSIDTVVIEEEYFFEKRLQGYFKEINNFYLPIKKINSILSSSLRYNFTSISKHSFEDWNSKLYEGLQMNFDNLSPEIWYYKIKSKNSHQHSYGDMHIYRLVKKSQFKYELILNGSKVADIEISNNKIFLSNKTSNCLIKSVFFNGKNFFD